MIGSSSKLHIPILSVINTRLLISAALAATVLLTATNVAAHGVPTVVKDTFNLDGPGTPLPAHTLETDTVGGGWVQGAGADFRITPDSFAAHDAGLDGEPSIAVIDTLVSEFDLEVTVSRSDSKSITGVVFRYVDENNYFAAVQHDHRAKLLKVAAGHETVLDDQWLSHVGDVAVWRVEVRSEEIEVSVNGHGILDTHDHSFADATFAGLIYEPVQTTSFRDFEVKSDDEPVDSGPGPEPSEAVVSDSFTAVDGTPIELHTGTEVGGGWAELRGDWAIFNGKAALTVPDASAPWADQIAVIPAGSVTEQDISADITWTGGSAGVVWNATDASHYSLAFWEGGSLVVGRVEPGVFHELGRQKASWSIGQTRNLRVQVNGNTATVHLDGSEPLVLAFGVPAPTALNAGIFVRNGFSAFDNFTVRESAVSPVSYPPIPSDVPFPPVSTVVPGDAWIFDSFDSPDYTLLQHRTPELDPAGDGWISVSGFWQIWQAQGSEQSGVFGPAGLDRFAVIDTGVDEYELKALVEWDGGRVGVMFGGRATGSVDAGRNGFIFFRNGESLSVGWLVGGVYFEIGNTTDFHWNSGDRKTMRVVVEGTDAKLFLDSNKVFEFGDAALEGSTWAGLFQRGRNDERFNDFTVTLPEGVEPPAPPGIGPIADVEVSVGQDITVPILLTGPGDFAPDLAVTATRIPGGTVVSDSLGSPGGSSVPLTGHTPDLAPEGVEWTQVRGGAPATVSGGTLHVPVGGDGGDQRVVIKTGYSDVEVSAEITAIAGRSGLVARHDGSLDDMNWVMGWVDAESGLLFLGRQSGGVFKLLSYTPFAWAAGETREMSLKADGADLALSVNGVVELTAIVDEPLSGMHAGVFTRKIGEEGLFDDFSVKGLGLPDFISVEGSGTHTPSLQIDPQQSDAGSYSVSIEAEHNGGLLTAAFTLTIAPLAGPTADAGGPYEVAEGENVSMDASASVPGDGEIVTYQWDIDSDGAPDLSGVQVEFAPLHTGVIPVTLLVTDENSLTSETQTTVTVVPDQPAIDLSALELVGTAQYDGEGVLLTPDLLWNRGAAWTPALFPVTQGFTATFTVEIDASNPPGADGFAFVIQLSPDGTDALGSAGDGIGYSQIENSIAVGFDLWANTNFLETGPHIAVHGIDSNANTSSDATLVGSVDVPALLTTSIVYGRVEYVPGTLKVYMNDFTTPVLEVPMQLDEVLDLPDDGAFLGFTASTGGASESHRVISFNVQV